MVFLIDDPQLWLGIGCKAFPYRDSWWALPATWEPREHRASPFIGSVRLRFASSGSVCPWKCIHQSCYVVNFIGLKISLSTAPSAHGSVNFTLNGLMGWQILAAIVSYIFVFDLFLLCHEKFVSALIDPFFFFSFVHHFIFFFFFLGTVNPSLLDKLSILKGWMFRFQMLGPRLFA